MKPLYTGVALIGAVMLGAVGSATIYKTIGISEEAKDKVVSYSTEWEMSQQDAVSKMVMEYGTASTTTPEMEEWKKNTEKWKVSYAEWQKEFDAWKAKTGK
jgi:hypothetical protein